MKTTTNRSTLCILFVSLCLCWPLLHAQGQSPAPGSAVNLDGTSGCVQAPSGTWFNGNFTVEGWVFARSYNNWSRLFDFANGPFTNGVYLALSYGTTGLPAMGVLSSSSSPVISSSTALPLNQWVHLACTFNNGIGTIYMNGNIVASGAQETPPPVLRTNNYIGRSNFGGDAYANAIFDEVRIWNLARTQGQIQAWMHRSLAGNEPGLTGYWRFDEGIGTTTADSTSNSSPASLVGGVNWTNSTMPMMSGAGSALSFNGVNASVSIPQQAAFNAYPLTVMTWFNSPATTANQALINKYVSSSDNGYQLFMSGGHLEGWYFRNPNSNVYSGGPMDAGPVNDGLWHHAAMVIDATGGKLYLDGVLKSSLPWTGVAGPTTTTIPISLGIYQGSGFWAGQLDEVCVWNVALTSNQIQAAMNRPLSGVETGLLGYWRLDEGTGTNIVDSSGNGNNGTIFNAAWVPSGARLVVPDPAYAVNLVATNSQYLQAPSGVWFNGDFTVEGWVNVRSYSSWSRLIDFADGPNTNNVYLALTGGTTGLPTMGVFTNDDSTPTLQAPANSPLPLNQWTHLAATLSGTTGTIYINGKPVTSGQLNVPPAVVRTNNFIGRSNYSADGYADAIFNEIRIWNLARTASQIQQTMGTPLKGTEPGLVGYWRLNEGTGTTTVDGTGNGNNLTLINSPTWVNASEPAIMPYFSGITAGTQGSVAWGDFNNDGLLDVLLTGSVATDGAETWQNQGNGTFTHVVNGMAGQGILGYSAARWGDYDNDGKLDVLVIGTLNGSTGNGIAQVWHNQGNGTFSNLNLALTGLLGGSVAWGDFDNDGKLDFIVTGAKGGNQPTTQVWRNLGSGVFSNLNTALPAVDFGSVALADFNQDGYLDVLITGAGNTGDITQVWLNQGNGTFTNLPVSLPAVYQSAVAVGDFNNDGYPDIVLTGLNSSGNPISQVWQNLGNGSFSNLNVPLPGVSSGSVAVGDYDNDGLADILLTGGSTLSSGNPAGPITQIWRNMGGGSFSNINENLQGVYNSSAAWGDFNSDGRLGILLSGTISAGNYTSIVYQTVAPIANTPPTPPTGLQALPGTNGALLGWSAATDAQTPANGLSYNVRIGTNSGGISLVSPEANPATGLRLLPQMGNAQERLSYQFNSHLTLGATYYWSVQAIDGGYAGSAFGAEGQFVVGGPGVSTGPATQIGFTFAAITGRVNPNNQNTAAWFQYGTTTNYGISTAVIAVNGTNAAAVGMTNLLGNLLPGTLYHYRLVATNSFGTNDGGDFTFTTPAATPPLVATAAATGLPGNATLNGSVTPNGANTTVWFQWGTTTSYGNTTTTNIVNLTNLGPVAISGALGGLPAQLYHFQLVASNSAGVTFGGDLTFSFPAITNLAVGIPPLYIGSVAWGDFNNDGLLDLLITGLTNGNSTFAVCQIWQNLGNGTFSNINASLPGVADSSVAWGDFDNDGYLDILLTGSDTSGNPTSQVWHNNGDGTFTLNASAGLPGVEGGSVALADFDRDGKLDILLTGQSDSGPITQVWRNQGDGTFSNLNATLPGVTNSSVAVGDFDNDGFPDIVLTGASSSGDISQVWRNLGNGSFSNLNVGLPGTELHSVAVADFDQDGFADILLTTGSAGSTNSQIWRNLGNGTFSNLNTALPAVYYSSVAVGDFDNDGFPDVLISGTQDGTGNTALCQIWRNLGNGSFTNLPLNLPGAWIGSVALGDLDNDGRLDFIVTGWDTNNNELATVWENFFGPTNTPPTAPTGLAVVPGASSVSLIWNAATDTQTPAAGLNYNIRLGISPGGAQIVSPEANVTNGFRRLPQSGNFGEALNAFVTNLTVGTTYYWSVQAIDGACAGSPFAAEASFVAGQPGAITGLPIQLSPTSEELTGAVNPNGFATAAWFQWGTSTNYGNNTSVTNLSGVIAPLSVSNLLSGLTQGLTYHYRLVASNGFGVSTGLDARFTTPTAPTVATLAASGTVPTSTTLNGTVLPNAGTVTAWFAYGTTASYGSTSAPVVISASNTSPVAVSNLLLGLSVSTTYHFQLFGSNIAGLSGGGDRTIAIPAAQPPLPNTLAASAITPNRATLNATVMANGAATTAGFLWGTNASPSNLIGTTAVSATNLNAIAYGNALQGLAGGTLYYYRAMATNSAAITFGPVLSFTTLPVAIPTPVTLPANVISTTSAILNGSVNPNGADTRVWFNYGTTTNYGSTTAFMLVSSNSATAAPASSLVSGLVQGTVYHFQLTASNRLGTVTGADLTFLPSALVATNVGLPGVLASSVAWGDFNNDGFLDILLTGQSGTNFISQVWQNLGNGSFSNINVALPGVSFGSVAWGDYDNDGYLDILLSGADANGKPQTQLWHNNRNGTFTQNTNTALTPVDESSVAWGDYDNDGWPDILLSGSDDNFQPVTQLWHNNGNGTFTLNTNAQLTPLVLGAAAWGDFDGDGLLDVFLTGQDSGFNFQSQLWRNNGDGTFTQVTNTAFPGVAAGSVAWGDYDNDGKPDLLLTGLGGTSVPLAQLWHNNGDGTFSQNTILTLTGVFYSSAAWGDYDNDGLSDILLTGADASANPLTQVWRNNGDGTFSQVALDVPAVFQGSAAFGDYNNNGKLDILLTGATGFDTNGNPDAAISEVLLNVNPVTNTPPAAPSALTATIQGLQTVVLSWNRAGDLQTPTNGLTYNIRVGTTSGGSDVLAPDANPASGFRRLPQRGNAQGNLSATLRQLPSGHYYWSVQTIDSAFAGSPFASERQFIVGPTATTAPASAITTVSAVVNGNVNPNGFDTTAWFEWGASTSYGSNTAPILLSHTNAGLVAISNMIGNLNAGTVYHFQLLASNFSGVTYGGDQTFTTETTFAQINAGLPGVEDGALAWGDYDNDGRLDILLTGDTISNNFIIPLTQIWRNLGGGTFSNINAAVTQVAGSAAWGDFDNDGQLDILISGYVVTNLTNGNFDKVTQVWRNTGNGSFSNINAGLPALDQGSVAWGDYDNDGRPDIFLCGYDNTFPINPTSQLWHNTGNGFTNSGISLPGVIASSVAWADYDGDGRLDLLITGFTGSTSISQLWRNTGAGFTNSGIALPGVSSGAVAWGDFDNDGRPDILISGENNSFTSETRILRNTGTGFTDINAPLPQVQQGSVAWGDYDNDGRSDVLLSGYIVGGQYTTAIWRNIGGGVFTNINAGLVPLVLGQVAWGDYDNDGRLDLLASGEITNNVTYTELWHNQGPNTNTPPTAPSGLAVSVSGSSAVLSWNASTDTQTPTPGLSYNLRLGTTPGGIDVVSPEADVITGALRLPQLGNAQERLFSIVNNLGLGTYYWSVQAVDSAFAGSPFAPEASFTIARQRPVITGSEVLGGQFVVQFNAVAGPNYTLQSSTNLAQWVNLGTTNVSSAGPCQLQDLYSPAVPQTFYRLWVH